MSNSRRPVLSLLLAAAIAAAVPAYAAEKEQLDEARLLFAAMHFERQLNAMMNSMGAALSREQGWGAQDPKAREIIVSETLAVLKERATQPGGMVDLSMHAYADAFTLEEIRQIRQFYESPAGQKLVAKIPEVTSQLMQESVKSVREAVPDICTRVKARLTEEKLDEAAKNFKCVTGSEGK
jgi:uncharacterized protein